MADVTLKCRHCGRADFGSQRALTQHLQRNIWCKNKAQSELRGDSGYHTAREYISYAEVERHESRANAGKSDEPAPNNGQPRQNVVKAAQSSVHTTFDYEEYAFLTCQEYDDDRFGNYYPIDADDTEQEGGFPHDDDEDASHFGEDDNSTDENAEDSEMPDADIWAKFYFYADHAYKQSYRFSPLELDAIRLLATLRRTKASLNTYEAIMRWHLLASGKLKKHESLGKSRYYISRAKLFKLLKHRYNILDIDYNLVREITLPSCRARAKIIKNDAKACIRSLLTDPRISDEDYLFFGNDPHAPPPDNLDYIGDLNTGEAYIQTYHKLIKHPDRQILLPVIFYIDGAVTGQFSDLPVTAVKFTFGIFTRKARDRQHLWRTLGYIPAISKHKSRGRRQFRSSHHADSAMAHQDVREDEGDWLNIKTCPAQDLHSMLEVIFEDFVPLQKSGFIWSFMYKDKPYKNIQFMPFVPFIKCDTEEADKLCGAYTSRGEGVSQLCRYCCCPNDESDDHLADYERKTVPMISGLIEINDEEGLKELSQQNIKNACYLLRFGGHNTEGVHGACPLEMLHALLLGTFRYTRDTFFEKVGPTSQNADELNTLAIEYGVLFSRQSERDMPRTQFSNGIRAGKLMANEYVGILLSLAAVIRSTRGRELLIGSSTGNFAGKEGAKHLKDWTMLVETLLQWHQWLKGDTMRRKDVQRAQQKHQYIMYLIRKIGQRDKGRGLKLTKFHAILHMAQDIINFGVPMEYDTGSNESGHKATKVAAKLTQRRPDLFEEQVSKRLLEEHMLDLALEEIHGFRPLWTYLDGYWRQDAPDSSDMTVGKEPSLGGQTFVIEQDKDTGRNKLKLITRSKGMHHMKVEQPFIDFVAGLQETVAKHIDRLEILSNHHRNGDTFRGTSWFNGGVWRDWALIDFGDDGKLPCKIWGFADLSKLPEDSGLVYGGLENVSPGFYAIIESGNYVDDRNGIEKSEIFVPITKEVGQIRNNRVARIQFYLADVEAFVEPMVVVPDVGGASNAYLQVRTKDKWLEDFLLWLREPEGNLHEMYDNDWNSGKKQKMSRKKPKKGSSDEEDSDSEGTDTDVSAK